MLIGRACALIILTVISMTTGCAISHGYARDGQGQALLFRGMGPHQRTVSTESSNAQRYFDQGLIWAYGFNHDEAIRSFTEAARIDPNCAMAWWGIALCNGPHINNPVLLEDRAIAAWNALQRSLAVIENSTVIEQKLIRALSAKYANPPPKDRGHLDQAYADAMKKVWEDHPDDQDVGTLYAESLMDLHPWDMWTQDGKPKAGTKEVVAVLEDVLRLASNKSRGQPFIYSRY